jgi:Flp pilus assembly protein TadD
MPDQVIQLKAGTPAKITMLLIVGVALLASWFVVRWFIGNTIAEYFNPDETRLQVAQMAVTLAPNDPLPHWRVGNLILKKSPPDQIPLVVAEYEKAVSLAPNDYRFWMELGAAQEQAGEFDKAERSLRQAVKLAPSYAQPRWYLGNLLLRTDRYPQAFEELQRASDANPEFQPQLFNLAWQVYKTDFESLKAAAGNSPAIRAVFSQYLVARGRFDEGLRLWNTLSESEKRAIREAADSIIGNLIKAKRFHQAVVVWNDVAPGSTYRADFGHIIDRGFEDNIAHGPGAVFTWQVPSMAGVQIGITPSMGHTGGRSLRILFQVRSHLEQLEVSQLVPVQPNTQYDFETYLKMDKLVSAATPSILIVDATTEAALVGSEAAPNGNSDWQRIALSFKTGATTEAVRIKVVRFSCPESPVCPIFGTVWYDDFDLKARK